MSPAGDARRELGSGSAGGPAELERAVFSKAVLLVLALVLVGALIAGFSGLPLYQDGSWYLSQIVFGGGPAIAHGRFPAAVVQMPTVLLAQLEATPSQVRLGFTLSYALVPFLTLASCWLVVRRSAPVAFLWPALGIICLNVVNFSGVSEQILATQIGWILLLVALHRGDGIFCWLLLLSGALVAVVLHKLGGPPLALVATALLIPRRSGGASMVAAAMLALVVAAPIWFFFFPSAYEANLRDQQILFRYLLNARPAEWFWILAVLFFGMTTVAARRFPKGDAVRVWALPGLGSCVVLVAGMWLAGDISVEKAGLKCGPSYLAQLVLMGLAIVDARSPRSSRLSVRAVGWALCLVVASSSAITVQKAWFWSQAAARLEVTLGESTEDCVEVTAPRFDWIGEDPDSIVATWALPSTALHYQEPPLTLLLRAGDCAHLRKTGQVRLMRHRALHRARVEQVFGPLR